jgi:hypothetical protein
MSQCQIDGATSAPAIHIRNTGAGQAPRWIDMLDVSTETNALGPCLKVDDGATCGISAATWRAR